MSDVQSANIITVENFPSTEKRFTYDLGGNIIRVNSGTYRVKILFRWDNTKPDGNPDFNSMWAYARFSQLWATSNSGKFDIPRQGQEVFVTFSKGNRGQPLIIGSSYNSAIGPPADLATARAYYSNVLRSATVTQEGAAQASGALAITAPVPYKVSELGNQSSRQNFNEIGIYSMDNGFFTQPSGGIEDQFWFITQYLFPSAAPTLQQLVDDVRLVMQEESDTGGSTIEQFEGVNIYSNKSIFCQAAQTQIFNAGRDFYINAGNSIQLQVGRSTISIKDEGIVVQCAAGTPDTTKAYIEDYRGKDVNQGGAGVALPLFNAVLSVLPGRAAMRVPTCSMSGMYRAGFNTWFGSSFGSFIGSSSVRGLTTSLKAGSNFLNVFSDIQGLLNQFLNVLDTNVPSAAGGTSGAATGAGIGSLQAASGVISQAILIKFVIETIVSNVTALRGYFTLKSSSMSMAYDSIKLTTSELKKDGLKVTKNGTALAPFEATINDVADTATGGTNGLVDEAVEQTVNLASEVTTLASDETNLAENRTRAPSESRTNAQENDAAIGDNEGTVQSSDVNASEQDLNASHSEGELSNQSTTVDDTSATVNQTGASALETDVAGVGSQTDGVTNQTGVMKNNVDALNNAV